MINLSYNTWNLLLPLVSFAAYLYIQNLVRLSKTDQKTSNQRSNALPPPKQEWPPLFLKRGYLAPMKFKSKGLICKHDNKISNVKFGSAVSVVEIPSWRVYDETTKKGIWRGRRELKELKRRNRNEFRADRNDWRQATEEDQMKKCFQKDENGNVVEQLVHPATFKLLPHKLVERSLNKSNPFRAKKPMKRVTKKHCNYKNVDYLVGKPRKIGKENVRNHRSPLHLSTNTNNAPLKQW
jgi:hypothetical protein